jgi:hypothetical protein
VYGWGSNDFGEINPKVEVKLISPKLIHTFPQNIKKKLNDLN